VRPPAKLGERQAMYTELPVVGRTAQFGRPVIRRRNTASRRPKKDAAPSQGPHPNVAWRVIRRWLLGSPTAEADQRKGA